VEVSSSRNTLPAAGHEVGWTPDKLRASRRLALRVTDVERPTLNMENGMPGNVAQPS
jgi:hypothetical protein